MEAIKKLNAAGYFIVMISIVSDINKLTQTSHT